MPGPVRTPNPATTTRPEQSSRRVVHKTPLGWLPWLALGLLALLLAIGLLLINAVDDDGPDGPAGDSLGQANSQGSGLDGADGNGQISGREQDDTAGSSGGNTGSGPNGSGETGGGTGGGAGQSTAALRVGDADLLALPGGNLAAMEGQPARGTAVVESVVADEGFWVGPSAANRVFVYLTEQARRSAGESKFTVKQGQKVQLTGQVVALAQAGPAAQGVTDAEGRDQLRRQGGLVEATAISLAG